MSILYIVSDGVVVIPAVQLGLVGISIEVVDGGAGAMSVFCISGGEVMRSSRQGEKRSGRGALGGRPDSMSRVVISGETPGFEQEYWVTHVYPFRSREEEASWLVCFFFLL